MQAQPESAKGSSLGERRTGNENLLRSTFPVTRCPATWSALKRQVDQEKSPKKNSFFRGVGGKREHDPEVIVAGHALLRDPGRPLADLSDRGAALPDRKDLGIRGRAFEVVKNLPSGIQDLKCVFEDPCF